MIAKMTAIMTVIRQKVAIRTIIHQTIAVIKKMIVSVVQNVLRDRPALEDQEVLWVNLVPLVRKAPAGEAGGVLNYADFYALMPPDNSATVAPGTDVSFPQDGPNSGSGIIRTGPDSFNLTQIG